MEKKFLICYFDKYVWSERDIEDGGLPDCPNGAEDFFNEDEINDAYEAMKSYLAKNNYSIDELKIQECYPETIELYLINQYQAYSASEVGEFWSDTVHKDTMYYKSEVVRKDTFYLPWGVSADDVISVHTDDDGKPLIETQTEVYRLTETTKINERQLLGQRIAALRQKRGISQSELAELVEMHQPNIARIEAGRYSTTMDVLMKIAKALNARLDFVEE